MPIRPENKKRYPKNWAFISADIRFNRAGNRCENCGIENGSISPITGKKVSLSVAHLDHTPENCDYSNLRAWCNRCHILYDIPHHKESHYIRKFKNQNKIEFPGE